MPIYWSCNISDELINRVFLLSRSFSGTYRNKKCEHFILIITSEMLNESKYNWGSLLILRASKDSLILKYIAQWNHLQVHSKCRHGKFWSTETVQTVKQQLGSSIDYACISDGFVSQV